MINAEEYFLKIAQTVSEQSTCLDKAVGCVITSADNQIASTTAEGLEIYDEALYYKVVSVDRYGNTVYSR